MVRGVNRQRETIRAPADIGSDRLPILCKIAHKPSQPTVLLSKTKIVDRKQTEQVAKCRSQKFARVSFFIEIRPKFCAYPAATFHRVETGRLPRPLATGFVINELA
jgi:hypothetical protein